ncbi:MAG: VTT domain-containing protein [Candidatus Thiodiazotropha sp. 6PLUC2]
MSEFFAPLLIWIGENPLWAGIVVFLVAFSESVALFGLLVPGVVAMFGFGALIATGTLEFWPVFWWAVAGAVAGDGLSFWLGRHYQQGLRKIWPFNRYPKTLYRGIDFFEKYGGKSVAIGRFFGPVRAIIPLVAGMLGMSTWRFFIANLSSALAWAPIYLLPGIVFGASLELASEVAFRLVILMLMLLILAWGLFKLVHTLFRLFQPHAKTMIQKSFEWGQLHRGFRSISSALADPQHPEAKGLAFLATLLLLTTLLSVLLTGIVLDGSLTKSANEMIHNALQSLRTPWGDQAMYLITSLGDLSTTLVFGGATATVLLLRGHYRTFYYLLAAVAFGLLTPLLLKYGLRIPRPTTSPDQLGLWSFPSAHVLRSVTLYGFYSIMVARILSHDWRWLPYSIATAIVGAVALSRLYLGVHWVTDVLGSLTLGIAWLALLGIAYYHHVEAESRISAIVATGLAILTLCLLFQGWHLKQNLLPYQVQVESQILSQASWLSGQEDIPASRHDLRGADNHPLNLQYSGDLELLAEQLSAKGWEPAKIVSWDSVLRLLSPSTPLADLPVLPHVHNASHEKLVLVKNLSLNKRIVLRLWATRFTIEAPGDPLYLGNVSTQRPVNSLGLLVIPRTESDFTTPTKQLLEDLEPNEKIINHSLVSSVLLLTAEKN